MSSSNQVPSFENTISTLIDQLQVGQRIEVYRGAVKVWERGRYLGKNVFQPDAPNEPQRRLNKNARIRILENN